MNETAPAMTNNTLLRSFLSDEDLTQTVAKKVIEEVERGSSLTYALLNNGVNSKKLFEHAQKIAPLPIFDLKTLHFDINDEKLTTLMTTAEIEREYVYPIYRKNGILFVGVTDPTNTRFLERLRFKSRSMVQSILVEADGINHLLSVTDGVDRSLIEGELQGIITQEEEEESLHGAVTYNLAIRDNDPAIIKYINGVLTDAINKGASDLHFEPYEHSYRIRFRIDGVLQEMYRPPESHRDQMAARLKVMSQLDITERRKPQDGRIKVIVGSKVIDFRVSVLPTLWGEKIVLRILDSSAANLNINILGFEEPQKRALLEAVYKPQGMVLVTGPTGSGKTVTLYTCMGILNNAERNLSTAEDPVEINLEGINQVHVQPAIGFTFAEALRSFLRQDPDVIMVGEIRDLETADVAIKAAQTGHLVLSTLHTNSAPETLSRLLNMGVEPFNIASTVHMIVAQRLARRLCSACKEEVSHDAQQLEKLGFSKMEANSQIFGPVGCDQCTNGYKGRVGIYEVMPVSEAMERLILKEATAVDIADLAKEEGVDNIRRSAIKKVLEGVTSVDELMRVTID